MKVELSNYQTGNIYVVGRVNDKNKYASVSEYYTYLEDKYPCLTASGYKVTISPAYLEKCINDPECAELLEKNLAHLPVSHQNMTAFWSARGAEVVNEQWNFDENGNCGGGTNMYVVSKDSSSSSSVQKKYIGKKKSERFTPQEYYEKRKHLREQFEEAQAKKERLRAQFEEKQAEQELEHDYLMRSWYSESRMTQASASYEANILVEPAESGIKINKLFTGYDALDIEETESIRYKVKHTIIHTPSWFSDEAGEELHKVKEEKGAYNGSDVLNAYGFTYARLYEEIEQRHENGDEQWFGLGGEPLTKEKEIEELNKAYEGAVEWATKCAEVMTDIQNMNWTSLSEPAQNYGRHAPEVPKPQQKDPEEMKHTFYEARDRYMELYKECKQAGEPLARQDHIFGHNALLAFLAKTWSEDIRE